MSDVAARAAAIVAARDALALDAQADQDLGIYLTPEEEFQYGERAFLIVRLSELIDRRVKNFGRGPEGYCLESALTIARTASFIVALHVEQEALLDYESAETATEVRAETCALLAKIGGAI